MKRGSRRRWIALDGLLVLLLLGFGVWRNHHVLALGVGYKVKMEKQEKLNGVAVTRIGFKEKEEGEKRILGTRGNAAAAGRFWIEAATGAVLETELWATSPNESVVNTVVYAKAAELDLWAALEDDGDLLVEGNERRGE